MSSLILKALSLSEAAKLCIDLKMVLLAIADIQTLPSYSSLKSIYDLTARISLCTSLCLAAMFATEYWTQRRS